LPRIITTVSDEARCLWIGITVPGSRALSIRWEPSEGEFRRSIFIRRRGEAVAWADKPFSICLSMVIPYYTPPTPSPAQTTPA
jgi:hypothetical protein